MTPFVKLAVITKRIIYAPSSRLILGAIIPYALSVSLITSIGPLLQQHVVEILNSNAPSLYEAVYDNAFARFPKLNTWINNRLSWEFIFIGLFVSLTSVRFKTFRSIIKASLVSTPIALTIVDLYFSFSNLSQISASNVAINIISNIIGGTIAALLASVSLLAIFMSAERKHTPSLIRICAGGLASICIAISFDVIAYYSFKFLFQPTVQKIDAVLEAPVTGATFSRANVEKFQNRERQNNLSFLPRRNIGGKAGLTSISDELDVSWVSEVGSNKYNISVYLVLDCPKGGFDIQKKNPTFVIKASSNVKLRMDGTTSFYLNKADQASYAYAPTAPVAYWIKSSSGSDLKITHFVSPEDPIEILTSSNAQMYIGGPLLRVENNKSIPTDRILAITSDNNPITINYRKAKSLHPDYRPPCRVASTNIKNRETQTIDVDDDAIWVGALIQFTPVETKTEYTTHDAKISLTGASGWFSVDEIKTRKLENLTLGDTGFLSFHGNVNNLRASGAKIEASEYDEFVVLGDLNARYLSGGKVAISGTANVFWRNQERLSPTKWELLSQEAKIALIPILLSIGGLIEFLRRQISKRANEDISELL